MNHEDCDCFAVTILSHGAEGFVYGTNEAIEIRKLVEPLKTCKTLVGKPKLFFIQVTVLTGLSLQQCPGMSQYRFIGLHRL